MDIGNWVALGAALISVIALIAAFGQARSARQQALAAKEQVELARRQTEIQEQLYRDQQQPYVWVDYRIDPVSHWLLDLVLKNEGPTIATNVRVSFDPPISRAGAVKDLDLDTLPGFQDGFASLPPGREMRWTLGSHVEVYEENALKRHTVKISFDGPFGPVGPLVYELDYADGKSMALRDPGNLKALTEAIKTRGKEMNRTMVSLERAVNGLRPASDLED